MASSSRYYDGIPRNATLLHYACVYKLREMITVLKDHSTLKSNEFDDDIWTYSPRVANELQLVETATSGCVVTCDYYLLLLDGEGESLQAWIFGFEDSRVEAVVVLSGDVSLVGCVAVEGNARTYEMHNHAIFFASRDLSLFHLSLIVSHFKIVVSRKSL